MTAKCPFFGALLLVLALAACAPASVPARPGPEGWLSVLGTDPALVLSDSADARDRGWSGDNAKAFQPLPSGALRVIGNEAASLRRDVDASLLSTPYLTWRWRLDAGPLNGYAPLQLAIGFETAGEARRLIVAWADAGTQIGRLERRGNAAFFVAQSGNGDGNWHEATLDIAELHRLAWPDINTLKTRITYVALFTPGAGGPAQEIEKLSLMR